MCMDWFGVTTTQRLKNRVKGISFEREREEGK